MSLTPTEREEHFFKAMVDAADGSTPDELEPTERREHWYNEIIDAIKAGVGGSGGGGTSGMLVTISHTKNGNTHTYTMDKTGEEIKAALDSGISPVFYDVYNGRYESIYAISIGGGYYLSVQLSRQSSNTYPYRASTASSYPSYTYTDGGGND